MHYLFSVVLISSFDFSKKLNMQFNWVYGHALLSPKTATVIRAFAYRLKPKAIGETNASSSLITAFLKISINWRISDVNFNQVNCNCTAPPFAFSKQQANDRAEVSVVSNQ